MARPLKYGEKTSVRSITIPDSMWANIPSPKSQWVVEAVRQMQGESLSSAEIEGLTEQVKAKPYVIIDGECQHSSTVQVTKGLKCTKCGANV